jgi:hypothetical protein
MRSRFRTCPNAKNVALAVDALQTSDGDYVTAVGPPIAEPGCGAAQVALHDDAAIIGSQEEFTMVNEATTSMRSGSSKRRTTSPP